MRSVFILKVSVPVFLVSLALPYTPGAAGGSPVKAKVSAPTRLDWLFALANQSLAEAPGDWLGDYDSAQQEYDLFVPPGLDAKRPCSLFIFISPGERPSGWQSLERVCEEHGVLFASPYGAGNQCPMRRRVRIVMDVLDDVRRRYPVDPDRTYIGGFSGGGRVACAIAFALPEYFGGVVSVCAGGSLRDEPWLRQRVVDRLGFAFITGETDFNRGEVERYSGPLLAEYGVRTRVWVETGMGHGIPEAARMLDVYRWLEADSNRRRKLHDLRPASSVTHLGREEWADALLAEAKGRLRSPRTLYSGLMQLKGVYVRWNDLPAAAEARRLLAQYDGQTKRPWEDEDIAEQRRYLIANARALDAYASGPLPPQYAKMRSDMVGSAIALWTQVSQEVPDTEAGKLARSRIGELQKLLP